MPVGLDPWALVGQNVDTSGLTPAEKAQFDWLSIYNGVPPDVARSMATSPSYAEGQGWSDGGWPTPYKGGALERNLMHGPQRDESLNRQVPPNLQKPRYKQDISYQPGASAMPGMPWDQTGAGAVGGTQMTPQQQLMWRLLMNRGAGGMQPNPNTNNLVNQLQGGAQQGMMSSQLMQMLQYYMAQQAPNQQGVGSYPSGGGVDLTALLGLQPSGQPSLPSNFRWPSPLASQGLS